MDPERHTCTWKNLPVALTVTEFLILQALASRPGVVKSRDALMDAAYDEQVYVDDRTIDSHVKRLRKKFKATDIDFDIIETLYGVGYRIKEFSKRRNRRHRDWPATFVAKTPVILVAGLVRELHDSGKVP